MTNMTVSAFVYWILGLQLILILSIVHTGDRQISGHGIIEKLTPIVYQKSSQKPFHPTWMANQLIRNKRNGQIEDETILRRHARHRKRHRCKNRSTCFRNTYVTRLSLLRDDTMPVDETSKETKDDHDENAVLETTEEPRDRLGESHIETDGENYMADTYAENGKSDSKNSSENGELSDSYDERFIPSEIECDSTDRSAQKKTRSKKDEIIENTDYIDEVRSLAVYSAMDDQVILHESLSVLLSKLFQSLRNASTSNEQDILKQLNFVNGTNEDPCQKWLDSKDKLEQVFSGSLASLPACPCHYPSNIFYDDKIWDVKRMRYFRWRDVSGDSQRLDVYKPGATYCVLSLLTQGSGSAAAQHCCYDRRRKLLTRGSGAGTPNFVSPEISPVLHERIDVLPWRLCKGDFSRYNGVRPPNNDNACESNPDDEEYQRQIDDTKYY
ncbi:PREDICTED: uncharacterized protein LOC108548028 [Eufriesea mexicana]|uniref:uncharacterized protein LOC108548028 n=1 Tax=Eufriesea mexicana TaxID=516756 RepID=UPI00083C43B7|nr:PREDICTED: uncharacterized protein LOC108548028 [Eufriesea mexicana]